MSCLTLRSRSGVPIVAAEVLGDDDVGGLLRPEPGDLDVALLEDDLALLVADDGRAEVPFDLVERIDPFSREEAVVFQPGEPDRLDPARSRHRCRRRVVDCVLVDSACGAAPLCIFPSETRVTATPRGQDPEPHCKWMRAPRLPKRVSRARSRLT